MQVNGLSPVNEGLGNYGSGSGSDLVPDLICKKKFSLNSNIGSYNSCVNNIDPSLLYTFYCSMLAVCSLI